MRGIPSLITDIRKKVFTEVARMAYAGQGYECANDLPYVNDQRRWQHGIDTTYQRRISGDTRTGSGY